MIQAFVTGAAGQLGSALVSKLVASGFKVTCLVKPHHDTRYLRKFGVLVIRGDLCLPETYAKYILPDSIVFHCYSLSPAREASQEVYHKENVEATEKLLSVCSHVSKFVYMSSCSIVGLSDSLVTEESVINPKTEYAKSKLAAEKLIEKFHHETGITALNLRIFPLFGPRCHPRSTPYRLCVLLQKKRFFMIGDGSNDYEFCFSRNAADMIVAAAQKFEGGYHLYNCTEPVKHSYKEIITTIARHINPSVKIVSIPVPLAKVIGHVGDVGFKVTKNRSFPRSVTVQGLLGGWTGDSSKLANALEYKQKYSLEDGVKELVEWFKRKK